MTTTPSARKLTALMKKIGGAEPPALPGADDPVGVLISSFLLWEATTAEAIAVYERLTEQVVDSNDLRVCMPGEIVSFIGERYPQATVRAQRLRATLRDVYLREHDITLERAGKIGKREVRKYVESLDGIVPYVANRLMLVCYDAHVVPVDERLQRCFVEAGVAEEEHDVVTLSTWLSKQVKAGAARQFHADLQAWSDATGTRAPTRKKKTAATPAAKKTTAKKATAKKATAKKTTARAPRAKAAATSRARTPATTKKTAAAGGSKKKATGRKSR